MEWIKSSLMKLLSGNWDRTARYAIIASVALVIILGIMLLLQPPRTVETRTYNVKLVPVATDAGIEVVYRAYTPLTQMTVPFPAEQFSHLSVSEDDEGITIGPKGDYVDVLGSEPFGLMSLMVGRDVKTPEKDYPIAQFGKTASVVNLRYFEPIKVDGQNVSNPDPSAKVFQWLGGQPYFTNDRIQVYTDTGLPTPLLALLVPTIDTLATYFEENFGAGLSIRPDLMFLHEDGGEGQLKVEGDSVRGQIVIKYTGLAFQNNTPEMQVLVQSNIAHEMVHLWQLEQVESAFAPDWLHEGAADALAAEALYVSGLWSDEQYFTALTTARDACAEVLRTGTVRGAASRGHHQASYACGHMVMAALAPQREGRTTMAMWRAFTDYAGLDSRGMSEEAFFDFAEEWAGSDQFANSLKSFVVMNYGSADRVGVVDKLFAGTL